tara:strand:+ start:19619 stop:19828 length:210 start_codon:yes stop_codon:yes gene_type:complete
MQQANQSNDPTLDTIRIEFMDINCELNLQASEVKKKTKARKRFEARRAIEEHQENKRLQKALTNWWDEI